MLFACRSGSRFPRRCPRRTLPADVLRALAGNPSRPPPGWGAAVGQRAVLLRGADGKACMDDPNHCQVGCDDGSVSGLMCKNCQCLSGGKCCGSGYVCSLPAGVAPNPQTGVCQPYCPVSPSGKVCYGNGKCTGPNTCECKSPGFDAAQGCKTCKVGFYGPNCDSCPMGTALQTITTFSSAFSDSADSQTPCSSHGTCDGSGTTSGSGTCKCNKGFAGNDCSVCVSGYGPPGKCDTPICESQCKHGVCSAPNTCTCQRASQGVTAPSASRGMARQENVTSRFAHRHANMETVPAPDTCTCDKGWSGDLCDVAVCDTVSNCNGNGKCIAPETCSCDDGFQGKACDIANAKCCATHDCSVLNKNTCQPCCALPEGHPGACDDPSYDCKSCDCGVTKDGKGVQGCCGNGNCQLGPPPSSSSSPSKSSALKFLRAISYKGTPTAVGHCCPVNKAGTTCERCAAGYFGPSCKACPKHPSNGETCSDHGDCVKSGAQAGTCACRRGWMGSACETCDESVERKCKYDCSGHGQCTCPSSANVDAASVLEALVAAPTPLPGKCACEHPFSGDGCDTCVKGFGSVGRLA